MTTHYLSLLPRTVLTCSLLLMISAAAQAGKPAHGVMLRHRDHHLNDSYILRMAASGSGKTRITDKSMGAGFETPKPLGWRQ